MQRHEHPNVADRDAEDPGHPPQACASLTCTDRDQSLTKSLRAVPILAAGLLPAHTPQEGDKAPANPT